MERISAKERLRRRLEKKKEIEQVESTENETGPEITDAHDGDISVDNEDEEVKEKSNGESERRTEKVVQKKRVKKVERTNSTKQEEGSSKCPSCGCILVFLLFGLVVVMKFYEDNYHMTVETYAANFELLEIPDSATQTDIKKAYRKMSLKWHPDKNPGCGDKCKRKFHEIEEAYRWLTDPDLMAWYQKTKTMRLTRETFTDFIPPEVDTSQARRRVKKSRKSAITE